MAFEVQWRQFIFKSAADDNYCRPKGQMKMIQMFGCTRPLTGNRPFKKLILLGIKTTRAECGCKNFMSTESNNDNHQINENSPENEVKEKPESNKKSAIFSNNQGLILNKLSARRNVSPSARLQSVLPSEFTESLTDDTSNSSVQTLVDPPQIAKEKPITSSSSSQQFIKRRSQTVSPSKRLSSLIPKDYWIEIGDTETKQIVDDLGENAAEMESSSDGKNEK